ncbi:flavodoxin family protein [Gorillibacterium sp. sgz500922]|uniref:flavodoxin family protein n=1 Tax=Gorillibacterium sp. sgz500922 TaxID=3446694 RepID=UPI003F66344E
MGNARVVYATKTRHSKRLAEAIARELKVSAERAADRPVMGETDLLIVVGGIYGGQSLPELLDFVRGLDAGRVKRAALVTSCASGKQGQTQVAELLRGRGIDLLGEHIGPGSFLLYKWGHPNRTDVASAVSFARQAAEGR